MSFWRYAEGDPEFGPEVRRRHVEVDVAQRLVRGSLEPRGNVGSRTDSFYAIDLDRLWQPVPVLDDPWRLVPAVAIECIDVRRLGPWGKPPPVNEEWWRITDDAEAWEAADPAAWFVDGRRFSLGGGATGKIRLIDAGVLRVPTGRLMAAEPGWSAGPCEPFTVDVPPGEYPTATTTRRLSGTWMRTASPT